MTFWPVPDKCLAAQRFSPDEARGKGDERATSDAENAETGRLRRPSSAHGRDGATRCRRGHHSELERAPRGIVIRTALSDGAWCVEHGLPVGALRGEVRVSGTFVGEVHESLTDSAGSSGQVARCCLSVPRA